MKGSGMISPQFSNNPIKSKKPSIPNKPKIRNSNQYHLLPPPPTPEEKILMLAKARKLNASAANLERKNLSKQC